VPTAAGLPCADHPVRSLAARVADVGTCAGRHRQPRYLFSDFFEALFGGRAEPALHGGSESARLAQASQQFLRHRHVVDDRDDTSGVQHRRQREGVRRMAKQGRGNDGCLR
jgi:hypothetical protein